MGILVYDEILVREPRLMVPNAVPVGRVQLNPEHYLRGKILKANVFNSYRPVDLLGNTLTYTKLGANMYFGAGNAGPGLITNNASAIRVSFTQPTMPADKKVSMVIHQHAPTRSTSAGWHRTYNDTSSSHWTYNNAVYSRFCTNGYWLGEAESTFDFEQECVILLQSWEPSANYQKAFFNGLPWKTSTNAVDMDDSFTAAWEVCGNSAYNGYKGITYSYFIFNHWFSDDEAFRISKDVYSLVSPA